MQKKVGLAAVLVLLCGVSAYLWMTSSGTETDDNIVATRENYNCAECGKQFELSVAEATVMLRSSSHDIFCPFCKKGGAKRDSSTLLLMAGGVPPAGGSDVEEEGEEDEDRRPEPGGSISPIDRP